MFRRIRIAILLLILAVVALNTLTDRIYTTQWIAPLTVALYPINADGSATTERYVAQLTQADFAPLESFFQTESNEFGIKINRPLRFTLAPQLRAIPPVMPNRPNVLQAMMWSLKMRWWAWRTPPKPPGSTARIRLFLTYHDPARTPILNHSTGLQKGLIGVVHLFADAKMSGSNQTVVAHELLHTLGATDKYEMGTTQPLYPEGVAEPELTPLYPQRYAELMAGRIPLAEHKARIPENLKEVVIGPKTAAEIGWIK